MCIKEIIKAIIKKPVEELLSGLECRVNGLSEDVFTIQEILIKMSKKLNKEQLKELFYEYRHKQMQELPWFLWHILNNYKRESLTLSVFTMYVDDYIDMVFEAKKGKKK